MWAGSAIDSIWSEGAGATWAYVSLTFHLYVSKKTKVVVDIRCVFKSRATSPVSFATVHFVDVQAASMVTGEQTIMCLFW